MMLSDELETLHGVSFIGPVEIAHEDRWRLEDAVHCGVSALAHRVASTPARTAFGSGEIRGRAWVMRPRSIEDTQAALATTEHILVSLRSEPDPDYALRRLIQALEDQQAELLASLLDSRAPRLSRADA